MGGSRAAVASRGLVEEDKPGTWSWRTASNEGAKNQRALVRTRATRTSCVKRLCSEGAEMRAIFVALLVCTKVALTGLAMVAHYRHR